MYLFPSYKRLRNLYKKIFISSGNRNSIRRDAYIKGAANIKTHRQAGAQLIGKNPLNNIRVPGCRGSFLLNLKFVS